MQMLVESEGETGKRARVALNHLKRGKSLSVAGLQSGLFMGLDAALIEAADAGGIYASVFRQLAQFYEEKARNLRKIKSRLFLPLTVLLLAVFIQPVPALISGKIDILSYLFSTVGLIIQFALVVFVVWRLPYWVGFLKPFGISLLLDKVAISIPYFGGWVVRRNIRDFLQSLGLMLQAGLPILEALPKAYEVVENPILRRRLQKIIILLKKGEPFAAALSQVDGVNPAAVQLISTGEHAGSLGDMMLHYVKFESEEISLHNEVLADWIPRFVYTLIVVWIAYGILSGGALMSPVPEDL
jgi:general secretion pathway protein F